MADDDFDFFDEPIASDTPKYPSINNGYGKNEHRASETESESDVSPSRSTTVTSKEKSNSVEKDKDENYSSDGRSSRSDRRYSDSFDEESDSDHEVLKGRKIEARVPSVAASDHSKKYSDYQSDSSPERSRSPENRSGNNRPKTAQARHNRKSRSSSGDRTLSETDSLTVSDTDSDVTDVSPLHSPKRRLKNRTPYVDEVHFGKPPKSPAYYGDRKSPKLYGDSHHVHPESDSEKMNLEILMQAVMEMEKNRQSDYEKNERIAKSRRVLFVPQKGAAHGRKNFSFSNDKVSTIDRENQRLMEKIVRCAADASKAKKKKQIKPQKTMGPSRMTPSAVNRLKEQQRIERENIALLKRLQKTSATSQVKRDKLLCDYEQKTIAGHSVAAAHYSADNTYQMTMINKRSYSTNNLDSGKASVTLKGRGKWSRPSSATTYITGGVRDPATVTLQSKHSRPTSASTVKSDSIEVSRGSRQRPQSGHIAPDRHIGKYKLSSTRPDWDPGW